nr:spermatogenesis-associated protein 16-like [Ciona intestinalis]|eukprot:XP_002129251.1 spermatogenesis-associated protein 16-like [Ciona intestinalis]
MLYDMNEDTQRLSAEEQVSINNLWCLVMEQARTLLPTVKVDYFPVSSFKHISENEIKATMAMEFLQTHPAYHSVIVPDAKTVHIIPSHDGEGFSYERSYQVCGFIDADETSTYVANLPRTIEQLDFTLHSISSASSTDQAIEIWNVVGLLNSTSYKLSQHPGKEIHEHLMYCIKLVQTSNLRQALNEIRSIIVDLRVLPMLPDYEWGETSDDFMEAYTSSLEGAIRSIEEHFKDTLEKRRGIGRIERLLEECELKHRVKKRFKLLTSSCKKTPKKKITNKAKRLRSYTQ